MDNQLEDQLKTYRESLLAYQSFLDSCYTRVPESLFGDCTGPLTPVPNHVAARLHNMTLAKLEAQVEELQNQLKRERQLAALDRLGLDETVRAEVLKIFGGD